MKFRCKKFISLVLTLLMLMSVVSATFGVLGAEEKILVDSGQCGADVYWYYYDDESLEFSGTGNMYDFAGVPSPWPESVTSVEIKDGITNIGAYAFSSALEKIVIADSVTTIGEGAFWGCDKLKELVFPANVDLIDPFAFNSCSGLEVITFNGTDVTVGAEAFENTALTDIYFGGTVEQWNNGVLSNVSYPNDKFFSATVHCTDGETTGGGNQGGDDFGDDGFEEIPEQICFGTIGLDETLTLDFNESNTVWRLEFTPDETGYYAFSASSYGSDTYGTVYNSQMESLASNDDYNGFDFRVVCEFEAGNTYYLEAKYLYAHETGSFDVCVEYVDDKVTDGNIPDDDGSEDYPDQITLNDKISVNETVTLDFDEANTRWLLEFTPEETGVYSFYSVSDSDTYGMLYDSYMDWLTDDDDGGIDCNFKITYELQAGETYYWAAKYLGDYETGSFDVTLVKSSYCDYYGHSFTNYVYNNDATQTVDGTKTAECDRGCGETETLTAYATATKPVYIDIYPGESKTVTLKPGMGVKFNAHSIEYFRDTEYSFYMTPSAYRDDSAAYLYSFYKSDDPDAEIEGGRGDDDGETTFFTFGHEADTVYCIPVWSVSDEDIEVTLSMTAHTHNYVLVKTYLPNCCEDGYDIYRCECGSEKYDNYVATDYECNYELVETRQPDCSDGYDYYECRGCWDGYRDNIVPGSGNHTFSNYTSNNDATCYSDGTKTSYCDVCDTETVVTDEGSKVSHRYSNYESNSDGTKTGYCIFDCGETDTITDVGESYDFEYYISDSKVTITRYTGDNTDVVVVPEEIEGYPVVTMSEDALRRDYEEDFRIDTIFLPKTLTNIEKVAYGGAQIFVDEDNPYYSSDEHGVLFNKDKTTLLKYPIRSSLSEYIIPDTVTEIGASSFVMAFNLTYVEIPDSVKIIDDSAFDMCTECDFSVGKNIEYVGYRAFFMSSIRKAAFGNNLKYMGEYSFNWCDELEEIILPAEFETESYIFEGNSSLRHIGFMGTEEQWNVIARRSAPDPEYLHLNYDPETAITTERTEPTCQQEGKVIEKCSCGLIYSEYGSGTVDHRFTKFVFENDGTDDMPPSRTAYCDYGCGEKVTVSFYDVIKNMSTYAIIYSWQLNEYDEWVGEDFIRFFDGEITKDNIDELILVALYCNYNFVDSNGKAYWQYPSLAWDIYNRIAIEVPLSYMNELFLNVYGADNVDFSISERYDAENGILFDIGGAGTGPEKAEATYEDGQFVVRRYHGKYADNDPDKEIIYEAEPFIAVTFDRDAHITGIYFPDLPEHTEHTFGSWVNDEAAGTATRVCTECGFSETVSFTNQGSGNVDIIAPENPDVDFEVEPVEGDKFIIVEGVIAENLGDDYEVLKAFDITLKNHDGVHVQPDGTVKVKLPLDWEKEGNYKVYRVNDDGTLTDMNAYRQGSHMVFETDHFSIYAIIGEAEKTPEEPDTPDVPDAPGGGEESRPFGFISELFRWLKDLIELLTSFFKAIA